MRNGTSGFWLEEYNGGIRIGYEDYGVSEFGGSDFEKTYCLDKENSEKLRAALSEEYTGTFEEMIEAAFTRNFSDRLFEDFCQTRNIKYSSFTWYS